MKYRSEVPKERQILTSQFPLLPGDLVIYKHSGHKDIASVAEVVAANPEYVLKGPGAKNAGAIRWTEDKRRDCENFLHKGHAPVPIRLKKSMWAVLEFSCSDGTRHNRTISFTRKRIYTYTIINLRANGRLELTGAHW